MESQTARPGASDGFPPENCGNDENEKCHLTVSGFSRKGAKLAKNVPFELLMRVAGITWRPWRLGERTLTRGCGSSVQRNLRDAFIAESVQSRLRKAPSERLIPSTNTRSLIPSCPRSRLSIFKGGQGGFSNDRAKKSPSIPLFQRGNLALSLLSMNFPTVSSAGMTNWVAFRGRGPSAPSWTAVSTSARRAVVQPFGCSFLIGS